MKRWLYLLLAVPACAMAGNTSNAFEDSYEEAGVVLPPIQYLYNSKQMNVGPGEVILNAFLLTGWSTEEGNRLFTPEADGLRVNMPGFYRVTYYQKVTTSAAESQIRLFLDRVSESSFSNLRSQETYVSKGKTADMQLTHVVLMNAGDKFRLRAAAYYGEAVFLKGMNLSGLTVEPVK